jgi:hypothetical protein
MARRNAVYTVLEPQPVKVHKQRTAAVLAFPPPCTKVRMDRIWTAGYRRFVPAELEFESSPWDKCPSAGRQ